MKTHILWFLIIIFGLSLNVYASSPSHGVSKKSTSGAHGGSHWGYSGNEGPKHWGELSPAYAECKTGKNQSPVDISKFVGTKLDQIEFHYRGTPIHFVNNGHTLQLNYGPGSYILVGGKKYDLLQFHFHTPSENIVNGKHYDMEMHLVHKSKDGRLAVVGIFLEKADHNEVLQKIWDIIPTGAGQTVKRSVDINAKDLLPHDQSYYHFTGSLTTPPCSEGVNWFVITTPIKVSKKQQAIFFAITGKNARPVQPLNKRTVFIKK